jgi:uncharacterized protein (TIGR02265 family)
MVEACSVVSGDAPIARVGAPPTALTPAVELAGTLPIEAIAGQLPKSYVVKGMFFTAHVAVLGDAFQALTSTLSAPPRFGRYVPFSDYPQADYLRVSAATAAKTFPGLSIREALRRLGRRDFGVFADSTFGKVILSVVGDAKSALLRVPMIYTKMAPGDWTVTGEDSGERCVRIQFAPVYGTWEYQLGQLEGVVLNYGNQPEITVTELPARGLRFDVEYR